MLFGVWVEMTSSGFNTSFVSFVSKASQGDDCKKCNDPLSNAESEQKSSKNASPSKNMVAKRCRGKVLGPKSWRKKHKNASDSDSSIEVSSSTEERDVDNGSKQRAVPRRVRIPRAAKPLVISRDDDNDDEDENDNEVKQYSGSDSDSISDPDWKMNNVKNTKKRQRAKSCDKSYSPDVSTSRSRGKTREQNQAPLVPVAASSADCASPSSVKVMPSAVAASTSVTNTQAATKILETGVGVSKPNVSVAVVSPQPIQPPPAIKTSTVQQKTGYASRALSVPPPLPDTFIPDVNPPHSCQKGDFILDRRDLHKYDSFPLWRIDMQRLLQKFECFDEYGRKLHRCLSTYASWPAHVQHNYIAVSVRFKSNVRGKEIVELNEKYRPRPIGVRENEVHSVREAFIIYVQILLSQSLEPTFIQALQEEPDDYYSEPQEKIDQLLEGREKAALSMCTTWVDDFMLNMKKYPLLTMTRSNDETRSQATRNSQEAATKLFSFHGDVYDHETLELANHVAEGSGPKYYLTNAEALAALVYHGVHHLKYKLYKICKEKVDKLKGHSPDIDDHVVLDTCLREQLWMDEMFARLTCLLEDVDRITGL